MGPLEFKIPMLADPPAAASGGGGIPVVTPSALVDGEFGAPYSPFVIEATGGTAPYTFAVTSGALPAGITLASNGTLSGTPSIWVDPDDLFTFEVTATDANMVESDPVEFNLTVNKPAVFDGLVMGVRAADYNATTGTAVCFNNSAMTWDQPSGAARPARDDTGAGPKMVCAGSQNIIANNDTEASFNNLDDATVLMIISNDADATVFWFGSRDSTTNNIGPNLNTLDTGAGVWRVFEYRGGATQIGPANIARWGTSVGTIGMTTKRNTANQSVAWRGSASTAGTVTMPNSAWVYSSLANFNARIGSSDNGSSGCSGNIHAVLLFNKALDATEMQALLEYLEDNVFYGTNGVVLW